MVGTAIVGVRGESSDYGTDRGPDRGTDAVDRLEIAETSEMEFSEVESGDNVRGKCLSCRKWVRFDQLKLGSREDLTEAPCPYWGDSGEELREKARAVKRDLEDLGY